MLLEPRGFPPIHSHPRAHPFLAHFHIAAQVCYQSDTCKEYKYIEFDTDKCIEYTDVVVKTGTCIKPETVTIQTGKCIHYEKMYVALLCRLLFSSVRYLCSAQKM